MSDMNTTNQTEKSGTADHILFDPQGYICGFVLTNGMEVYLPFKLLKEIYDDK
jgi:hypothetical protein